MAAALAFPQNVPQCERAESDEMRTLRVSGSIVVNCNEIKENSDLRERITDFKNKVEFPRFERKREGYVQDLRNLNISDQVNNGTVLPHQNAESGNGNEASESKLTTSNTPNSTVAEISYDYEFVDCPSKTGTQTQPIPPHCEVKSEDTSSDASSPRNKKQSYSKIKSKRKTLLKIEKLTDSDSRSRAKMRRRALSPPTSSDDENLYIGWIAYPASMSSIQKTQSNPRREVWMRAAKLIFSPVTKVCQKCIRKKVGNITKK